MRAFADFLRLSVLFLMSAIFSEEVLDVDVDLFAEDDSDLDGESRFFL